MSCANWMPANFRASPTNFALHGDLDTFVRQGPHATQELPKLPKALGINEKPWRGRRRWFFATWNGSVRRAHKRLRTARISRPQPLINTIRSTASMHRQSTRWTRTLRSPNAIPSLAKERPAILSAEHRGAWTCNANMRYRRRSSEATGRDETNQPNRALGRG